MYETDNGESYVFAELVKQKVLKSFAIIILVLVIIVSSMMIFTSQKRIKFLENENKLLIKSDSVHKIRIDSLNLCTVRHLLSFYDSSFSIENYRYAMKLVEVQHDTIVEQQHRLETSHFTSNVFRTKNNLGGYMNNDTTYVKFKHWLDCVWYTKRFQMNRYDTSRYKDYWEFLDKLPYAEAKNYIKVVKTIKNGN